MKRTVLLFLVCCATGTWAQSTCETRVDAHQKATTNERVNYCLQPGYGVQDTHGPQLIYSATDYYTVAQPVATTYRPTAKQGSFDEADIEVTRSFVQTRQFPKFTDGRVSEQYKREYQEALASGPQAVQEIISLTECEPQSDVPDVASAAAGSTAQGLKSRQHKPGRRLLAATSVASQQPQPSADTAEEVEALSSSYTYEEENASPSAGTADDGYGAYAPAGIAGEPAGEGQTIDAKAYSYAPAQSAPNETEIPAGEYAYAPATN